MSLVLYDYTMAPSPRRARIFRAEKQIPYETIQVDLAAGEHLQAAYAAINPACTVPARRQHHYGERGHRRLGPVRQ